MARQSLRENIVRSGVTTLHQRGYAASGVREITAAAGVPQGSFTNHFRSKEAFGIVVLDRYFEAIRGIIEATLRDDARSPVERLRAYFDTITELLEGSGWRHGCLIGNMSLEAPEHSEALRVRLVEVFAEWTQPFVEAVVAAQAAGELRSDLDPDDLAAFLLASWHGAMMRMKVDRSREPLDRFRRIVFDALLSAPVDAPSLEHHRD